MKTTYVIALSNAAMELALGLRRMREHLLSRRTEVTPSVSTIWREFAVNPQDLVHDEPPVDGGTEVRRQAADKALSGYI